MYINGVCYKNENLYKPQKEKNDECNQIKNFIMFYERLTKHMLKNFPKKAKFVIKIDKYHRLSSMEIN